MYIPDLAFYNYGFRGRTPLSDVKAVGWLSAAYPFSTGEVEGELVQKLERLSIIARVNDTRGFHCCEFCGGQQIYLQYGDKRRLLGTAEVWIPGDEDILYAAPDLIVHYIHAHRYLPPSEFLVALSSASEFEIVRRRFEFERRRFVGGDWDWKKPGSPDWWS
jgi:hypothetical protein